VGSRRATLLGAATRPQQTFPQANVFALALVPTMGFVEDIEPIVEPCIGTITRSGDEAVREP